MLKIEKEVTQESIAFADYQDSISNSQRLSKTDVEDVLSKDK